MKLLQDAEDNYYLSVDSLLNLSSRAKELFESSEIEEKRQLIKLVLQNLKMEGNLVRYSYLNPFDKIAKYSELKTWLPALEKIRRSFIQPNDSQLSSVPSLLPINHF